MVLAALALSTAFFAQTTPDRPPQTPPVTTAAESPPPAGAGQPPPRGRAAVPLDEERARRLFVSNRPEDHAVNYDSWNRVWTFFEWHLRSYALGPDATTATAGL